MSRDRLAKKIGSFFGAEMQEEIEKVRQIMKSRADYSVGFKVVSIILTGWLVIFFMRFIRNWIALLAFIGVVAVLIYFVMSSNSKTGLWKKYLQSAISKMRAGEAGDALDSLIEAYKVLPGRELSDFIFSFSEKLDLKPYQNLKLFEIDYDIFKKEKNKDKKLKEIYEQLEQTKQYIEQHSESIEKSRKKIEDLRKSTEAANNEDLKKEYKDLIKRYEDIMSLESSKVGFYYKAFEQLRDLKEDHIYTFKLLKEKEDLKHFEDNLLEKSIQEQVRTDTEDFVLYENAYLEAIKQYSSEISNSSDKNLFDEIIRNFENKTQLLDK